MPVPVIVILCVLAIILIIFAICAIRAIINKKPLSDNASAISWTPEEANKYANSLSRMVKVPTISKSRGEDYSVFLELQKVMAELYPNIFSKLERHDIEGNLLMRWQGKNSDKPAVLLMGHQDVVPAADENWIHEPFSGTIENGNIYGRGAMDCKSTVCCEFSAVEELLSEGFVPECDIWLFSSVNEENSGGGSEQAVEWLKNNNIKLGVVMDEGGAVINGIFPGLACAAAAVGVVEKGFCNVKFVARGKGGHSSTPPKNTPVARLAAFVNEAEKKSPFKKQLITPVPEMFKEISPYLTFPLRLVLSNMWLFGGLLSKLLPKISGMAGAFVQTTACFTMSGGSEAPNVIPDSAYVICNMRPSRHQNAEQSIAALSELAKKYDIETEILMSRDASSLSSPNSDEYIYLTNCIKSCIPDAIAVPYLMAGGTDCRQFESICDNCLRFTPTRLSSEQLAAMHAANENIGVEALSEGVKFYKYFIEHRK